MGVAYGLAGRFDDAIATANQLVALNPKYKAAYMNLSVSYRMKGNMAAAEVNYNKARELDPKLPPFNEMMAQQGQFVNRNR